MIAEQTNSSFLRFGASLFWNQPHKFTEAIGLGWQLRGIPYRTAWPVCADGSDRVESVTLTDGRRTWIEPCDAPDVASDFFLNHEEPANPFERFAGDC